MSVEKVPSRTVPARILHWAAQQPERNAYVFCSPHIGRATLTRRNLKDMAFTFADRLAHVGMRIGDVVCNTLQVQVVLQIQRNKRKRTYLTNGQQPLARSLLAL